jgi:hypothetical protein
MIGQLRSRGGGLGRYVLCRYCNSWFDTDENEAKSCSYHPKLPVCVGDTGPREDYADIWTFPCCGKSVKADIVEGRDAKPEQTPGCKVGRHVEETGWSVFISYARADQTMAVTLENELRRRGHKAWRDRSDIVPGADWAETIDRAIADADHIVLLLTPRAVASAQVKRELQRALDAKKNVVPVLAQDSPIPESIRHINCVDWRSTRFATEDRFVFLATEGFDQLREAVVFGPSDGPSVQVDDATGSVEKPTRPEPPPTYRQTVLLKDADGEILAKLEPQKRYQWHEGHVASVDGVVYVVVDVLQRSRSNVEVRVERLRVPVDRPTS